MLYKSRALASGLVSNTKRSITVNMKLPVLFVIVFLYGAMAQQQDTPADASTVPPPAVTDEKPQKPSGSLLYRLFIERIPDNDNIFVPFESNDNDAEFQDVAGPLEYQFNDRFSVEPFFTFPPNAGGGLNFIYRF